jgi:hypothetical protein
MFFPLSSLFSSIQGCFHEHAKVRIRMLKMEERLKGVPKWFNASQRHPFIPLIEGIDISPMMKDVDGIAIIDASMGEMTLNDLLHHLKPFRHSFQSLFHLQHANSHFRMFMEAALNG